MSQRAETREITYSPSWTFIPTHYCRNTCGYCVFVERKGARAALASPEQARAEIKRARAAGATELLIMSGEGVEASPRLREALSGYGFATYLDYLLDVSALALEDDLLPHINVGNLTEGEFESLKRLVPSMGMMLETTSEELREEAAHRLAPDKAPARRLETLRAAGRARLPFTTGILIGIGETPADREESLRAIADIHLAYGHIQEVIIQPFTPHAGTVMAQQAGPGLELMREIVSAARAILPPEVRVQIPPNLVPAFLEMVEAGARDLGGISPDGDRINPDERWHEPARYARSLQDRGFSLRPRLAVHERYLSPLWLSPETWRAAQRVRARLPEVTIAFA